MNNTQSTAKVDLSKAVIVYLASNIWSGETVLRDGDVDLQVPKDIVRIGTKRLYPSERLAPFHTLRRRAQRACMACGRAWLGGYLIPVTRLDELLRTLDVIDGEFEAAKADFVADYQRGLVELQTEAGEWWPKIAPNVLAPKEASDRMTFTKVVFKPAAAEHQEAEATFASAIDDLPGLIIEDIATDALDFWTKSVAGKEQASRRAINTLSGLTEKIAGMALLDGRLMAVEQKLTAFIASSAGTGPLSVSETDALSSMLLVLADPERLEATFAPQQVSTQIETDNACEEQEEPAETQDELDETSQSLTEGLAEAFG